MDEELKKKKKKKKNNPKKKWAASSSSEFEEALDEKRTMRGRNPGGIASPKREECLLDQKEICMCLLSYVTKKAQL